MNRQPQTAAQEANSVQGSLQRAMLQASEKSESVASIVKPNQPHSQELPMLIPRTDLLNQDVIFLAHTLDREAETIQYYDMKKGSKPSVAGIGYYKSTRPIKDQQKVTKMVQDYSKEFGVKEVILRERLVKTQNLERDENGQATTVDVEAYKQRLLAAVQKAIMDTI